MEKLRLLLLAVISGYVFCILGKLIIAPTTEKSTVIPFAFPATVPLLGWQPIASSTLANPVGKSPILSGRHYRYVQNDTTLNVEMRDVANNVGLHQRESVNSIGLQGAGLNIKLLIQLYSSTPPIPIQLSMVLRQQEKEWVGSYYLFAINEQAYLSTCINRRGGSTVSEAQFQRNQYLYDLQLSRIFSWLLGQGTVRDTRCLWAHLSIPLQNSGSEDAYKILEKAWEDWYQLWRRSPA